MLTRFIVLLLLRAIPALTPALSSRSPARSAPARRDPHEMRHDLRHEPAGDSPAAPDDRALGGWQPPVNEVADLAGGHAHRGQLRLPAQLSSREPGVGV